MTQTAESTFSNQPVARADMPDYRQVDFRPPADRFRRYALLSTLLFWAIPMACLVAARFMLAIPFLPALLMAAGISAVALAVAVHRWLDAGRRGWALREHDIIACAGVLWRSVTALPVARIQHVETTHGPLERAHGLARLKLYTAGGLTADLVVVGLARDTADQLREYLVEQIRKRDSEGAFRPDE